MLGKREERKRKIKSTLCNEHLFIIERRSQSNIANVCLKKYFFV